MVDRNTLDCLYAEYISYTELGTVEQIKQKLDLLAQYERDQDEVRKLSKEFGDPKTWKPVLAKHVAKLAEQEDAIPGVIYLHRYDGNVWIRCPYDEKAARPPTKLTLLEALNAIEENTIASGKLIDDSSADLVDMLLGIVERDSGREPI